MAVIAPIIFFVVLGTLAGVILTIASKKLAVPVDERVAALCEALPGANCGGCGFSGCEGYAVALAGNPALGVTLCAPGGKGTAERLAEILGVTAGETVRTAAAVACRGCVKGGTPERTFDSGAVSTCAATARLFGGDIGCTYGCLGYGDCAGVCDYGAVVVADGHAVIDVNKCTVCGRCVKACPKKLIAVHCAGEPVVRCANRDFGKAVTAVCDNGCIGCRLCAKKCPAGAIEMDGAYPVIDYGKCTKCGDCVAACAAKKVIRAV